jgi:hypothetical protein
MQLALWCFQSDSHQELYALSTGRTPPAEDYVLKDWKRLETIIDATEDAIRKITHEQPALVLRDIEQQEYHTLDTNKLRVNWIRPTR